MGRVKRITKGSNNGVVLRLSRGITKTVSCKSPPSNGDEVVPTPTPSTRIVLEDVNHYRSKALDRRALNLSTTSVYIHLAAAMQVSHKFVPVVIADVRIYQQNSASIKYQALYKLKIDKVTTALLKEFSDSDFIYPIAESRFHDMIASGTLYDKGAELKPFEVVISVLPANFFTECVTM